MESNHTYWPKDKSVLRVTTRLLFAASIRTLFCFLVKYVFSAGHGTQANGLNDLLDFI